jgi:hypothetical protein
MPDTARDLITDALREIRVLNATDPPSAEDAALGLVRLSGIFDDWDAEERGAYVQVIDSVTTEAASNPHTYGPTGTWVTTARPETIAAANVVIGTRRRPVDVRSAAWWMGLASPTLSGEYPTDLYLETAWPDGRVWLYPVPPAGVALELLRRGNLASDLTLASELVLPRGWRSAVLYTLAERLAPAMGVSVARGTATEADRARGRIFDSNAPDVGIVTDPLAGGAGDDYDYRIRI